MSLMMHQFSQPLFSEMTYEYFRPLGSLGRIHDVICS
jgi:hypothetical protein